MNRTIAKFEKVSFDSVFKDMMDTSGMLDNTD